MLQFKIVINSMYGGTPPQPFRSPEPKGHPLRYRKLHSYDQERLMQVGRINLILYKPRSFMQERRCEKAGEWCQQYFQIDKIRKEFVELVQYYRFYRNSPTIGAGKYIEIMNGYWSKTKAIYYRKVKRELELCEESSEVSGAKVESRSGDIVTGKFELPDALCSYQTTFLNDPDATLRHILTAMTGKEKETRQASQVNQFQEKQGSKSSQKNHMHTRTNPSHMASTTEFKKQKKKSMHKSVSNDHKKSVSKEKKLGSMGSCKKIVGGGKQMENALNYQRRGKPEKGQKIEKNKQVKRNHRESKPSQLGSKEVSNGKVKSSQKSQGKGLSKKLSSGKLKELESTKVKAAIVKARDKIKAEKGMVIKKYMQERSSCVRSIDSKIQIIRCKK